MEYVIGAVIWTIIVIIVPATFLALRAVFRWLSGTTGFGFIGPVNLSLLIEYYAKNKRSKRTVEGTGLVFKYFGILFIRTRVK